jgi:hypothetical protein
MQPVAYEGHPRRNLIRLMTVAALLASATATMASPAQGRRHVAHRWHGYGFLPGIASKPAGWPAGLELSPLTAASNTRNHSQT